MRVAMVLPGLGRVQRGAETAFVELSHALAGMPDVTVEVFGSGRQGLDGLDVHVIPCTPRQRFERWPRFPMFRSDCHYEEWSFTRNLKKSGAYDPRRFDVVVGCTFPHLHWFLRKAGKRGGPKIIYVTQNGDWPCRSNSRESRFFRCDGLVCINPEYDERHRESYRAALIPNGVDPDVFKPGERTPRRVVLMVSALIPSKRVAEGIRAVSKVEDATLMIAGDGPLRSEIASLARELLPGRHELLGAIPRSEMPGLFRKASAFLHTSQDEPFGIVFLEAAASGLPIVAHDGAVPRWVLGDCGRFAETSDADAVADQIRAVLDPEVGNRLGRAARMRVLDGWTWRDQAERYHEFFREICGEAEPSRVVEEECVAR